MTAATEPSNAERTGTARTPEPGSNALRVPTTAAAGSPAAAAARATADEPTPAAFARPDRTDRQHGQQPEQGQAQRHRAGAEDAPVCGDPAVRGELPHRPHRGERRHRDRARHGQRQAADDRDQPGQGRAQRGLRAGGAQDPQHRGIRRGPGDHLGQALSHQHQHGQRRDRAEHAQRDRLRPDRLLHMATDDVGAVDRERGRSHVAV
jgi:hypothetical protein